MCSMLNCFFSPTLTSHLTVRCKLCRESVKIGLKSLIAIEPRIWPFQSFNHARGIVGDIIIISIYSYIPETNHAFRVYNATAVLYLQFILHVMLFRPWNMFSTIMSVLPTVRVQCTIWLFLQFRNFVASRNICSGTEWFWNGSSCPYYYRYHFCFHILHALDFYCNVLLLLCKSLRTRRYGDRIPVERSFPNPSR